MTAIPLWRLLAEGRAETATIAVKDTRAVPFARFAASVAGGAQRLRAAGYSQVILSCDDSFAFAVGFFAALQAELDVVLPANGKPATLAALHSPTAVVVDADWLAAVEPATVALPPLEPMGSSILFFTSGSTGAPKPVTRSLLELQAEIDMFAKLWGEDSGEGITYATVPHQHLYGLTFKLLWPLSGGRPFAAETHALWETLLPRLDGDSMVVSSPAHLARMGGLAPLPRHRCPRRLFSAGAPLPTDASREAEGILGVAPTEIFGSTETGAIATRVQQDERTPWQLLPGVEARCDGDGRLWLKSPARQVDGWLRTEDRVAPEGAGFHLLGRADRVAKIEAKRIDLAIVERLLEGSEWVETAVALVVPGPPARLAAVVVPSLQGWERIRKVGNFKFGRALRAVLALNQDSAGLPRLWRFVERMPTLPLGKHNAAALQAFFGGRDDTPAG
jgi:acyl-coenzyme A synthetase/AMP-(fatty) acid ligase